MHFQDFTVVGCILATVARIVNCGINFQSISVHPRFDTEYYDHIYSCHYCTGDTQQANLIWRLGQGSLGGFHKSHMRGRVISKDGALDSLNLASDSIFLIAGSLNGTECLSSLLIIGSNNATSKFNCTCNYVFANSTESLNTINQTQSEDGNVQMDYVFARNDVTEAYSLSYHGITCRTSQSDKQVWHVNDHKFELQSNKLSNANFNSTDGVDYVIVPVSMRPSEIISFLSVSYVPPRVSSVIVSCSNTFSSHSIHLLNVSSSAAITETPTINIVSSTTVKTAAPSSGHDLTFSSPPTSNTALPRDSRSIIVLWITVIPVILLLSIAIIIIIIMTVCRCFMRKKAWKHCQRREADLENVNQVPLPQVDETDGVPNERATNRPSIPGYMKIRKQWSLEEGEDTGFLYCTYKKEYYNV